MVAPRPLRSDADAVAGDESLLRRFPAKKHGVIPVAAFKPRPADTDGLSVYREDCVDAHSDVVAKAGLDPEKQPTRFSVAKVSCACLVGQMTTQSDPRKPLAGHCLIPELHSNQPEAVKIDLAGHLHRHAHHAGCYDVADGKKVS